MKVGIIFSQKSSYDVKWLKLEVLHLGVVVLIYRKVLSKSESKRQILLTRQVDLFYSYSQPYPAKEQKFRPVCNLF
jgi:hypothetical protein